MQIYNIDFKLQWERLLPPAKRQKLMLAWGGALVAPIQWMRRTVFDYYANGVPDYNNSFDYSKGDRVRFNTDNKIYELIQETPDAGFAPPDPTYWLYIPDEWRGARERINYNGQKLILEYLLNRWFSTAFRQPDSAQRCDIYINTNNTDDDSFIVAESEDDTSYVAASFDFEEDFVGESYNPETNNFTVFYPITLIPDMDDIKFKQLQSLVERYKLYGTTPNYESYVP